MSESSIRQKVAEYLSRGIVAKGTLIEMLEEFEREVQMDCYYTVLGAEFNHKYAVADSHFNEGFIEGVRYAAEVMRRKTQG